jgi:protein TonB
MQANYYQQQMDQSPAQVQARQRIERVSVSTDESQGMVKHRVQPEYPQLAYQAGVQGTVLLKVLIDVKGHVKDVKAISGPPLLIQAAIDAVKQWEFRVYLKNGKPAEMETQVAQSFSLVAAPVQTKTAPLARDATTRTDPLPTEH